MKKDGTILLLDINKEHCSQASEGIKAAGFRNNVVYFTAADEAASYVRENIRDIFMVMQSTATQAVDIPHTRNMVYMHEKFDTEKVPYMFLLLNQKTPLDKAHTFVHCYYKPDTADNQEETLVNVVSFWKDHVFPPKVNTYV